MGRTIKNIDIARILKISPTAVSLALNDRPGVSPETRAKVHELKYGKIPEVGSEVSSHSDILFVVHKKHGRIIGDTPFFMSLTETIQKNVTKAGYSLRILYVDDKRTSQDDFIELLGADSLGILLLATELDYSDLEIYRQVNKPIVLLDTWIPDSDYDSVLMDNYNGVFQSLKCAAEYGHKRIGFVSSDTHCNNFIERYDAFVTYASKLGIQTDHNYNFITSMDTSAIVNEVSCFIREGYGKTDFPTLFICANDMIALGVINAVTSCGLRIPEDISIIGFDDMPVSGSLHIPLTSVHINHGEIGYQAVKLLLRRIRNGTTKGQRLHIQVGVKLIERASVSKLS